MIVALRMARASRMVAVAACTWAAFARAEAQPEVAPEATVVVVRSSGLDGERHDAIVEAVQARLRAMGRIPVNVAGPAEPPSLEPALARAVHAYHELRPEDAAADLDAVAIAFERLGTGLDREALVQLFVVRALSAIALGRPTDADAAVDRALQIDPLGRFDPATTPPSLVRLVERRRANVRDAQLTIASNEPIEKMVIDGLEASPSASVIALAAGRHVVRVESAGWLARALVLEVPAGVSTARIDLEADHEAALRARILPGASDAELVAAAARIDASVLVVDVSTRPDAIALRIFDGELAHERSESLGVDSEVELIARTAVPDAEAPISLDPAPESSRTRAILGSTTPDEGARRRRRIVVGATSGVAAAVLTAILVGFSVRNSDAYVGSFERVAR